MIIQQLSRFFHDFAPHATAPCYYVSAHKMEVSTPKGTPLTSIFWALNLWPTMPGQALNFLRQRADEDIVRRFIR